MAVGPAECEWGAGVSVELAAHEALFTELLFRILNDATIMRYNGYMVTVNMVSPT